MSRAQRKRMVLLIHTSTPTVRLGLAQEDRIVAEDVFPVDRECVGVLAERVWKLLTARGVQPSTLTDIVIHAGPGGFTTLRIGVTTANALAYALGVPVIGVTGTVGNLADLLKQSEVAEPAPGHLVLPVYAKPPDIGPVSGV